MKPSYFSTDRAMLVVRIFYGWLATWAVLVLLFWGLHWQARDYTEGETLWIYVLWLWEVAIIPIFLALLVFRLNPKPATVDTAGSFLALFLAGILVCIIVVSFASPPDPSGIFKVLNVNYWIEWVLKRAG